MSLNHVSLKEKLLAEAKDSLILFICMIVMIKLMFFNEPLLSVVRIVFSLLWMFFLPGYLLMLNWHEEIGYLERSLAGIGLSAAIIGTLSYYLGILGFNVSYHYLVLPLALALLGFYALRISSSRLQEKQV